jgi:hypothetical protein
VLLTGLDPWGPGIFGGGDLQNKKSLGKTAPPGEKTGVDIEETYARTCWGGFQVTGMAGSGSRFFSFLSLQRTRSRR